MSASSPSADRERTSIPPPFYVPAERRRAPAPPPPRVAAAEQLLGALRLIRAGAEAFGRLPPSVLTRAAATACALACLLAIVAGQTFAPPAPDLNLVSQADVAATATGTPARTVVSWFQAIQRQRTASIFDLMTLQTQSTLGERTIAAAVRDVGPLLGRPKLVNTTVSGDLATVRLEVLAFAHGASKPARSDPLTFQLQRVSGRWLIADAGYIVDTARDVQTLLRARLRAFISGLTTGCGCDSLRRGWPQTSYGAFVSKLGLNCGCDLLSRRRRTR